MAVGPPKQRAVLGFLAGHLNRAVSVEETLDAVWGSEPPRTADSALHTYVAGLRRALDLPREDEGAGCALMSTGGGYALRMNPEDVDARSFEQRHAEARRLQACGEREAALGLLESALGLWHGAAYTAVPGPFAGVERIRLQELRFTAVEEWASEMLTMDRHAETVASLRDLAAREPLRERLRGLLMVSLESCGRRAEALAVYRETREMLRRELGVDPGPGLRLLHDRIRNDRPAPNGPKSCRIPGQRAPRPAQLPPTARGFIGRSSQLRDLADFLAEGPAGPGAAPRIAVIDGAPGVGKSALGLHLAHETVHRFPDGQLFVDLCGSSPRRGPLGAFEALGLVLRSLGVREPDLPAGLPERTRLFRELLCGKSALLFLDDAHDLPELAPLLAAGPSAVVVTSRCRRQAGPLPQGRVHRIELSALTLGEAVELLSYLAGAERIAGADRDAVRLARLCGRLPLALRIIAEVLAEHPDLSVTKLADAVENGRLDELTVLGVAPASLRMFKRPHHVLPRQTTRKLRLLGLSEGPEADEFTVSAAAASAGTVSYAAGPARARVGNSY
ncbi:BTAD domain-containing putative transcriptional regulator [Streptomyces sp. NPDC056486]|uniref:AfsR/SARP family transcriptional regulator n=1 Tax=Streptomyces sp. NPDC056486 TaxID=3345835 RepID=UPI00368B7787